MKKRSITLTAIACGIVLLTGCSGGTPPLSNLDRVLEVAADSLDSVQENSALTKENVMKEFSSEFAKNLNSSQPLAYPSGPLGVKSEADGSFLGFHDENANQVKDSGETDVFKLEVDAEKNRLLASDQSAVRDSPLGGLATGLLAGMLLSSIMNRQRATGSNPASKRATSSSAYQSSRSSQSARSRSGSGSHSSGK